MTDYSPLHDALEETGGPVTVEDMVEAGYDDFDANGEIIDVQTHILQALDALNGHIFDDPAKWRIVNELVAALDAMDELCQMETAADFDGRQLQVEIQPRDN